MTAPSQSRGNYPMEPQAARVERRSFAAAALGAAIDWPGRVLAAVDAAIDTFLFWRGVSATIQRLSLLDDATLRSMEIERQEIVPWVYQTALAERRSRVEGDACLRK